MDASLTATERLLRSSCDRTARKAKMAPLQLLDLPNELLSRVLHHVDNVTTWKSVAVVSKRLSVLANECIYAHAEFDKYGKFAFWASSKSGLNKVAPGTVRFFGLRPPTSSKLGSNDVGGSNLSHRTQALLERHLGNLDALSIAFGIDYDTGDARDHPLEYMPLYRLANPKKLTYGSPLSSMCYALGGERPSYLSEMLLATLEGYTRLESLCMPYVEFYGKDSDGFGPLLEKLSTLPIKELEFSFPEGLTANKVARIIVTLGGTLKKHGLVLSAWRGFLEVESGPSHYQEAGIQGGKTSMDLFREDNPGVTEEAVRKELVKMGKESLQDRFKLELDED